jgi:hypothetical protein
MKLVNSEDRQKKLNTLRDFEEVKSVRLHKLDVGSKDRRNRG